MIPVYSNVPGRYFPPITIFFILLCIGVFILDVYSGFELRKIYCIYGTEAFIVGHEPWRLLTGTLFHHDLEHLVGNMIVLYFLGSMIEEYLPKTLYILLLLMSGIIGSYVFILMNEPLDSLLLGFSGAILGLYFPCLYFFHQAKLNYILLVNGGFLSLPIPFFPILFFGRYLGRVWVFVVVELFINIWLFLTEASKHTEGVKIAVEAHLAGFITGAIITLIYVLMCELCNEEPLINTPITRKISQ